MSSVELIMDAEAASPVPATDGVSLSELAYSHVLEAILSGRIKPGAMLQERKLAELFSMSRTPIREALGRLEAELLITRSHGRAPVVANVSVENYIMLLDMRRVLEVEAAGRATGNLAPEKAAAVIAGINSLQVSPAPSPAEHYRIDELVHVTIAEAAGNQLIATTIRDLRRRTHMFNSARIPKRLMPGASEHLGLIGAVTGDDPERSRQLMGRHLDNVRDAIIEFLLGTKRS